jgi:Mrp family chromosome partitioning ATPase
MMAAPLMQRMPSPPIVPAATAFAPAVAMPAAISMVDQIVRNLRQAGDAGRRVAVVGATRNAGTTYAAITLARALASEGTVVLVDLAFGAPNLSVISTDPNAPGIAELVRGTASFGDIVTKDQYSNVHLVATGAVGNDAAALTASPMLATVIEALVQTYNHVVIDAGSAADVAVERFGPLATRAVLVAADPANSAAQAVRQRLMMAGFADVALLAGAVQTAAA